MNMEHVVPTLKARWRVVAVTWLLVVSAVFAVSVALPPRYEASASVAVEMNGVDPIAGQTILRQINPVPANVATQVDIMKSEQVALGALRSLGLDKDATWREEWRRRTGGEGDFEAWLATRLLKKLDVRPSRDSNVVTLSFSSPDPRFSAAFTNALVRSYIDSTLEMRANPAKEVNRFFAERAKPLRAALEDARARLSAYEKQHNVTIGEPDVESARLRELTSQLVGLQDQAAEAANLRRQARGAPGDLREVRNDPEVAALTGELVRQQGNLADLRSEFGERHEAVIQARRSVADTRARLNAAMRRAADALAAPARVIEARLAEVRQAIERQRKVVLERKAERDAAGALVRDVENAQRAYDAVLARASQSALEGANRTQTTISVLKTATPPPWSWAPVIRNVAVAAVLGALLAIARALLAEARDRRLRTISDVTAQLRQPLLLILPDGRARVRGPRGDETRRRLVSVPLLPSPR